MNYIPSGAKFKYLSRSFLLTVIYQVRRSLYEKLKGIRDAQEEKQNFKNYEEYSLDICSEFREDLLRLPEMKGIYLFIYLLEYEAKLDKKFIKLGKKKKLISSIYKNK